MNTFQEIELSGGVRDALKAMKFEKPTPIQAEAIPHALDGRDIIGCAQTGTGKTAAFCIPTLTRLLAQPGKTALILAPTRELVQQIEAFWRQLTRFTPKMHAAVLIGGAPMGPQLRALKTKPRVIIATPGRLIDHLERRTTNLFRVETLILDEADRMLDMGFAPQLERILKHVPRERQTLLFTATWPATLDKLSKKYLHDPVRVTVGNTSQAAPKVAQSLVETTSKQKNDTLLDTLKECGEGSVLVFARTKARTDRLARFLTGYGVSAHRIHGGRSQGQRNSALNAFRRGRCQVLVATDVAARGIDVTGIGHVINYDLPQVAEDYIHRIGRTGRAGATGAAVSFVVPEERKLWVAIARLLKKSGSEAPQPGQGSHNASMEPRNQGGAPDGKPAKNHSGKTQTGTREKREKAGKGRKARFSQGTEKGEGRSARRRRRPRPNRNRARAAAAC